MEMLLVQACRAIVGLCICWDALDKCLGKYQLNNLQEGYDFDLLNVNILTC